MLTVPRRVGSPAIRSTSTTAAQAPKPKSIPKPRGFERGGSKPRVDLDARPAKPSTNPQRNVFDVVPQQPQTVFEALKKLDAIPGVDVKTLGDIDGIPVQVVRLNGAPPPPGEEPKRVLITGGVHGSEPAGTMSAVELLELVAKSPELFPGFEFTVVPLVNPEGFRDGTRHNENDDTDLNREAAHDDHVPKEMQLLLPVLDEGPWKLALDLHASGSTTAAGKNGFFAIRTAGSDELLHGVMSEFKANYDVLDETTARYTMVEPGVMESKNMGTVKGYLFERGTEASFTLEAPARANMKVQVEGLVDLVRGFLAKLA